MLTKTMIETVLSLRRQGHSYRQIAEECNISKTQAARICQQHGGGALMPDHTDDERVMRMYLDEGMCQADIARATGIDQAQVSRIVKRNKGKERKSRINQEMAKDFDAHVADEKTRILLNQMELLEKAEAINARWMDQLAAAGRTVGMKEWKSLVDAIVTIHEELRCLIGFIPAAERERLKLEQRKLELQ